MKIKFAGRIQLDSRFMEYDPGVANLDELETQQLAEPRRLRGDIKGSWNKNFQFKAGVDVADIMEYKDVYVRFKHLPYAQVTIGQFTVPFGNENMVSSNFTEFLELSAIGKFMSPSRDRGIMVGGHLLDDSVYYEAALVNGTEENVNDNNNSRDEALRVVMAPEWLQLFDDEDNKGWVGFSYTFGRETIGADEKLKLKSESHSEAELFKNKLPEGRSYDRERYAFEYTQFLADNLLQLEWYRAEYYFGNMAAIDGGYVSFSRFLTGERRTIEDGLMERQDVEAPFELDGDGWGAFELALRYSWFHTGDAFFSDNGLYNGSAAVDDSKYHDAGNAWTLALNWYPDPHMRLMLNYLVTTVSNGLVSSGLGASGTVAETATTLRIQYEF